MHHRSPSYPQFPFPSHVCDYLFASPRAPLDRRGVCIQPLSQSPSLENAIKEIETQLRRNYVRSVKAVNFRLDEETPKVTHPPLVSNARASFKLKKMMQELASIRVQYSPPSERDEPAKGSLYVPPIVPSQKLLMFLKNTKGQKTENLPRKNAKRGFSLSRKPSEGLVFATSRSPSPVLLQGTVTKRNSEDRQKYASCRMSMHTILKTASPM